MENKKENNNNAIIALVLGILSVLFMFLGWGAILGLACGIVAIVFAKKSEKSGMTTAGFVCGIVGSILSGLALILLIIVLIAGNSIIGNFGNLFFNNSNKEIKEKATNLLEDVIDRADEELKKEQNTESEISADNTKETTSSDDNTQNNTNLNGEKIAALEKQLTDKKQTLEEKRSSITDLTTKMQTAIANGQTDQLAQFQKEIADLNLQIVTLTSEINSLNNQIESLK